MRRLCQIAGMVKYRKVVGGVSACVCAGVLAWGGLVDDFQDRSGGGEIDAPVLPLKRDEVQASPFMAVGTGKTVEVVDVEEAERLGATLVARFVEATEQKEGDEKNARHKFNNKKYAYINDEGLECEGVVESNVVKRETCTHPLDGSSTYQDWVREAGGSWMLKTDTMINADGENITNKFDLYIEDPATFRYGGAFYNWVIDTSDEWGNCHVIYYSKNKAEGEAEKFVKVREDICFPNNGNDYDRRIKIFHRNSEVLKQDYYLKKGLYYFRDKHKLSGFAFVERDEHGVIIKAERYHDGVQIDENNNPVLDDVLQY